MIKRFIIWIAGKFGLRLSSVAEAVQNKELVTQDRYEAALVYAFQHCGVSLDLFKPEQDLVHTGKVYELLHHASLRLDKNHELRTVQDLLDWLREAPRA